MGKFKSTSFVEDTININIDKTINESDLNTSVSSKERDRYNHTGSIITDEAIGLMLQMLNESAIKVINTNNVYDNYTKCIVNFTDYIIAKDDVDAVIEKTIIQIKRDSDKILNTNTESKTAFVLVESVKNNIVRVVADKLVVDEIDTWSIKHRLIVMSKEETAKMLADEQSKIDQRMINLGLAAKEINKAKRDRS